MILQRIARGQVDEEHQEAHERLNAIISDKTPGIGKLGKRLAAAVKSEQSIGNLLSSELANIEHIRGQRIKRMKKREVIKAKIKAQKTKEKVQKGDKEEPRPPKKKSKTPSELMALTGIQVRKAIKNMRQSAKRRKLREEQRKKRREGKKAKPSRHINKNHTHSNKSVRQLRH